MFVAIFILSVISVAPQLAIPGGLVLLITGDSDSLPYSLLSTNSASTLGLSGSSANSTVA